MPTRNQWSIPYNPPGWRRIAYNPTNPAQGGFAPTPKIVVAARATAAPAQSKLDVLAELEIEEWRRADISETELRRMLPSDLKLELERIYNWLPLYPTEKHPYNFNTGLLVWYTVDDGASWLPSVVIKETNVIHKGVFIPSWLGHKLPCTEANACTCPFGLGSIAADVLLIPAYGKAKPDSAYVRNLLGHPELTPEGLAGLRVYDLFWKSYTQLAIHTYGAIGV